MSESKATINIQIKEYEEMKDKIKKFKDESNYLYVETFSFCQSGFFGLKDSTRMLIEELELRIKETRDCKIRIKELERELKEKKPVLKVSLF